MSVSTLMRAEDAAALLGVPLDADLPTLRRAFRRLSAAWGPDKALESFERERFRAQSAAYTALVARCNENTDVSSNPAADSAASSGSGDLDLDCGVVAAADESEHWAILRLYKDLLSFYSDEESVRDTISPEVRLAIGMLPTENSERYNWTSEDEEGFDQDFAAAMSASEHASGGAASSSSRVVSAAQGAGRGAGGPGAGGISSEDGDDDEGYDDEDEDGDDGEGEFDPSSKRFSPLNFKDPASLERYLSATGDKFSYEMHMKRKLKNAKKKAEQRRKQKERRLREAAEKEEEAARQREREAELARQAEEAQRLRREEQRRAQELEAERRKQLFAAASRGDLDALKAMLESPGVNLRVTERINENGRSGSGLLHAVFAGVQVQPEDGQIVFSIADRVTLARYLLSMKAPSIDLGVLDEEGCNVLHIAAKVGQLPFVNTILDNRSESQEKRNQLDLNARCLHKGFTALHYAADAGHYDICEKLVDIGVLLNVHASCNKHKSEETSNSKGPTPLEIVKTKLELPSLPTSERQNYERVAEKISSALLKLERAKLAREQERQAREAKQRAEKEAQLLKEQKERELLERKQKLLREKQEKLGKQDAASQQQQQQQQRDDAASAEAPAVDSKKKKKDQKEKQPSLSEQKEEAKESKTISETMSTPQKKGTKAPNLSADARKDLCRHLMSMGFAESDCVAAIDACGANVEAAISWICDRPKGGGVSRPTPETSLEANVKASLAPSLSAPQSSAAQKPTVQEEEALALKLQREKEKLREINRKWNAKVPQQRAEEERKRQQEEEELRQEAERKKLSQSLAPHLSSFSQDGPTIVPPPPLIAPASSGFPYAPSRGSQMLATTLSPGVTYPAPLSGSLGPTAIASAVNASPFYPTSVGGRFQTSPMKASPALAPYPLAPAVPTKGSGKGALPFGAAPPYSQASPQLQQPAVAVGGKGSKARTASPIIASDFPPLTSGPSVSLVSDQSGTDMSPLEQFSNGAVELSVRAKEFVPKSAPGGAAPVPSSSSLPAAPVLKPTPIGLGLPSSLGGIISSLADVGAVASPPPVVSAPGPAAATSSLLDMGLWGTGSGIGGLGIAGLSDLGAGMGGDVPAPLLFPPSSTSSGVASGGGALGASAWSDLLASSPGLLGSSATASQSSFPVPPLSGLNLSRDSGLDLNASGILDGGLLGGLVGLGSGLPLGDFGGGTPLGSLGAGIDFSPSFSVSSSTGSASLGGGASLLCDPSDPPLFPLQGRPEGNSDFTSMLSGSSGDRSLLDS